MSASPSEVLFSQPTRSKNIPELLMMISSRRREASQLQMSLAQLHFGLWNLSAVFYTARQMRSGEKSQWGGRTRRSCTLVT
jgi:hypothetical protein